MELLGKATTKEFWQGVREKDCYRVFRDFYLERWNEECENTPPNSLRYSDWLEFWKSGQRIEFNYFQSRQQLMAATFLALIYPEEEKYIDRVNDQLFAITNEYTWCIPAHYGSILDGDRRKIDLFAAETALGLAEVYVLLGDRLDEFIKKRVYDEIEYRIMDSMKDTHEFGFESKKNNWSSVCSASVGCAAMLLFPERFNEIRQRIEAAINTFLSGYRDDGVCLEGSSYWSYGFGFFCIYADMISRFTGGEVNYFALPKVKRIATFMQKTFLSGSACASFSDGGRTGSFNVGLTHFLKKQYPDDIILYKADFPNKRDGCARLAVALMTVMWLDEEFYYNPEDGVADMTFYAEESEWLIRRLTDFGFAAKGGNNNEPHNHNDIGSFIFAKDGSQVLVDLGPGEYTKQYFSNERYNTFEACSRSHSVPIVDGRYQKNGSEFHAKGTKFEGNVFSLDIASAYPVEHLNSLVRTFTILDDGISLTDEIDYTGDGIVTERFVTLFEPKICDKFIEIGTAKLYYDKSVAKPRIEIEELSKSTCYLINFDLSQGTKEFRITVK